MKTVNDAGLSLIESFEGARLKAYRDSAGVLTIGFGHTRGVRDGQVITAAQAATFLREDLVEAEAAVNRAFADDALTDNQFASLVSFAFNLGEGNLRKLISKGVAAIPDRILLFNKARVKGVLTPLKGLTRRRQAERELFLKP